jgi:hypothetical protein
MYTCEKDCDRPCAKTEVKVIYARKYDADHLKGQFLDKSNYDTLITEDTDVYEWNMNNKYDESNVILKFSKNVFTKEEQELGFSKARQQGLLGALRTTILGPGVLTEIDAQRILDRLGGDITSVATNPALLKEIVSEVLTDKMTQYEDNLNIYNSHVAGRYGSWGVKQRVRVIPFTESNLTSVPKGIDVGVWDAMTPDEKKKFAQPKK